MTQQADLYAEYQAAEKKRKEDEAARAKESSDLYAEYQRSQNVDAQARASGEDPNLDSKFETAVGRVGQEEASREGLTAELKKEIAKGNLTPERRAIIENQLREHSPEGAFSQATTQGRGLKRLGGGVVAAFPEMFSGITDLAAAGVNAISPGQPLQGVRDASAEYSARVQELYGNKGVEGLIGNVGGTFGLGAVVEGASKLPLIGKVAKGLMVPAEIYGAGAKVVGKAVPPLARALESQSRVTRMAAAALADLPINAAQGLSQDGATPESIARTVLLGSATSALSGLGGRTAEQKVPTKAPEPNKITNQPITGTAEAMITAGTNKSETMKAKGKAVAEAKKIAKKSFLDENPGKSWEKDLSKTEQLKRIQDAMPGGAASGTPAPPAAIAGLPGGETAGTVETAATPVAPARERRLVDLLAKARAQTKEANAERRVATKEAGVDRLTGLANQNAWEKARIRIEQDPNVSVAQMDLNNFKPLNDAKGHKVGDQALRDFGPQLQSISDRFKVQVFRSGGDEFVFAGPHEQVTLARDAAEKLHDTYDGIKISMSGGVGHDIASTEIELATRKIAAKTAAGMPLTREAATNEALNKGTVSEAAPAVPAVPRPTPIPDAGPTPTGQPVQSPPGTVPLQAPPVSPVPPRPAEDFLVNVLHDKPLSQMTSEELDKAKDEIWKLIEAYPENQAPPELLADLDRAAKATITEHQVARQSTPNPDGHLAFVKETTVPNADEPVTVKPEPTEQTVQHGAYSDVAVVKGKPKIPDSPSMAPAEFGRLVRQPENKLSLDEKRSLLTELELRTASMVKSDAAAYVDKMNKLRSAIAKEIDPPAKDGSIIAYTRHETVGGIIGFFYGMTTSDDPEEQMKYAILYGLLGAGVAHVGGRLINPKSKLSVVPKDVLKGVKTSEDLVGMKPKSNFFERMRNIYQKNVRPALGGELFMKDISQGRPVSGQADVGKALASYGKHLAYTESWIADKPFWINEDGSVELLPTFGTYTDGKGKPQEINNAADIIKAVDGDVDGLGKFAAARTVLEIFKNKGKKTTGVDLMEAARLVSYMEANHPNYVAAADASRQLHIGLLEGMVRGGVISRQAKDLMGQEQFYASLERAFGSPIPGGEVGKKKSGTITSPNPVKERTGGADVPIKNPIETMVANIVRVMRAIEINRAKNMAIDAAESNPEIGKLWLNRIDRNMRGKDGKLLVDPQADVRVADLRQELGINEADAKSMVSNFQHEALDPTSPTMTLYRGGTLRTYRLEGALADSFRALSPPEMNDIIKMIGMTTNVARAGIVKNPVFIMRQAWRDNWQAMVNSQNGFVWGKDWFKGWWELASMGAKSKEFQMHGGGHTSLSFSDVTTAKGALTTARAPGKNVFDTAVLRVKELKFAEAYKALMVPMAEAARMGEYMRARGRGVDVQDAVFAAKSVVGNFQQTAGTLRALNQMALFVGPSVQAMDQSLFASGMHPFRPAPTQKGFNIGNLSLGKNVIEGRKAAALNYFVKGFVSIALPSLALRALYHDDKEVMDLANSEAGRGYWFYRINGTIHKSAKPIFEGQLFGTTAEMAFDKSKSEDAAGVQEWARAIGHDAAVNLLPLIGTVGVSMWTNKDYNFGGPIATGGSEQGSPEYQVNPNTSIPARVVGKALAPVSNALQGMGFDMLARTLGPAGIDYIVRNLGGTLAGDAMQGVSQAIEYKRTGMVPPIAEWPLIRGALVKYPTMSVASVQEFYNNAERVATVAHDIATLTEKSDPVGLTQYLQQHISDVAKIELYVDTRKKINDMRQAIEDMKNAPAGSFPPESIRQFERQMTLQMVELAHVANATARLMR